MIPQPLHPAVVHFPIVLGVLLPLVAILALVLIRRGESPRKVWVPVVALALGLAGSAWVATSTGEREEEAVEDVVGESVLHAHEEAAEVFLFLSVAALVLAGAGLVRGRPGMIARGAATVAALVVLGAGYRVGHSGGGLVYDHGAASVYVSEADQQAGSAGRMEGREGDEHDGDSDDDEGR